MKKNASRSRRLMFTKNSILMLVMLVIIALSVWAWYLDPHAPVTAEKNEIAAAGTDDIELALPVKDNGQDYYPNDESLWLHKIDLSGTGYLKNLVKDVTSNGEQFVVPNFEAAAGLEQGRKVIPDDVWIEGLSSKEALTNDKANDDDQYNYVSLEFYARSKVNSFQVTGGSYLAAGSELGKHLNASGELVGDESDAKPLTGTNIYRPSTYGDVGGANAFSADAIVGAMRVSLKGAQVASISGSGNTCTANYASGVSDTLRFVWLPRPDVYLKTDDNSDNWRLHTGLKPEDGSAYSKKSYAHTFYEGNYVTENNVKKTLTKKLYYDTYTGLYDYSNDSSNLFADCVKSSPSTFMVTKVIDRQGNKVNDSVGTTGFYPTLSQSKKVAGIDNVDGNAKIDEYYVYKFTLNLWIEGEDAEARRSMNDGLFSLLLEFGNS